jgi:hypothetical protein
MVGVEKFLGGEQAFALAVKEGALEGDPLVGEVEQALTAVGAALGLADQGAGEQRGEDAGEALLGDAEGGEEVADGEAGGAADEVQGAVMGAAEGMGVQDGVRRGREVAAGEIEHVLRAADLFFAQEQQAGTGCGCVRHGSPRNMASLLPYHLGRDRVTSRT